MVRLGMYKLDGLMGEYRVLPTPRISRLPPNSDIAQLQEAFSKKNLTTKDLVILSGAHTIGSSRSIPRPPLHWREQQAQRRRQWPGAGPGLPERPPVQVRRQSGGDGGDVLPRAPPGSTRGTTRTSRTAAGCPGRTPCCWPTASPRLRREARDGSLREGVLRGLR
uniref:Plant heme peroxidase family profile domain-containing protein n=1 Tax=Arundo donax TaxID=35708 RepID=A0A0A9GKM9_ARUDO